MSAKAKTGESNLPELREFVKENGAALYDFCVYLLPAEYAVDDLVLAVFREFGELFRKLTSKRDMPWGVVELRIRLFALAWEKIREVTGNFQFSWALGRDTRQLKGWDADILDKWQHTPAEPKAGEWEPATVDRLRRVDLEVRAPIVLRDILRFDDEEAVRILGIRWGVYRHRLHRGRLDFRELLHGFADGQVPVKASRPAEKTTEKPSW
jgi:hypothetical protein